MAKIQSQFSWKEKLNSFWLNNKFIYFIIFLILIIVSFIVYSWFSENSYDRNSYVQLIEWEAYLNEQSLFEWKKEKLSIWDIIKTTKEQSIAVIEWWDGSITRLWWNTELQVNELFVSQSKDRLNIAFELFSWKTWSNVLSYIPWDSYFKQSFMDMEAAVRWTVYNVDLENDYLYVIDHKVDLTTENWDSYSIEENKPFDINNFDFLKLEKFITEYKDSFFENVNRKLDNELFREIKADINKKISNLSELSNIDVSKLEEDMQDKLYNQVLSSYQDLNSFWVDDWALFELKLDLKEKLYLLSNNEEKALVADSFEYDLKDAKENNNYQYLNEILTKINNNWINVNESIKNYVENINYDNINPELRKSLQNNYDTFISNINIDATSVIEKANNVKDDFEESFWSSIINLFKGIFN